MTINNRESFKQFNKFDKINYKDIYLPKNICLILDHIINIDNEYYYFKNETLINGFFSDYRKIINEIIGSYLCELLGLDSLKYDIGISDCFIYSISNYLFDKEYTYNYINDIYKTSTKLLYDYNNKFTCKISLLDQIDDKDMLNDMLKLISIDLRMGQEDRHDYNIMIKKNNITGKISFAPIYDFSNAYICSKNGCGKLYENPLVVLGRDYYPIHKLCEKYPILYEYISKVCSVPITEIIYDIENKYDLCLSNREFNSYREKDSKNVKMLKMVK